MLVRTGLSLAVVLGLTIALTAQDKAPPLGRADLDRRAAVVAYETTLLGSQIYNKGNHEGCYRLYQGALIALHPMLDHRPKLATRIKDSLDRAKTMRTAIESSFTLRETLDALQIELTGGKPAPPLKPLAEKPEIKKEPLWARLGGEKAVRAVVHDFTTNAANDPKVNLTRGGKFPIDAKGMDRLERQLVEMISAATGGPLKYTGRNMKDAHKGMAITEAEFDAAAANLVASLKKFMLPKAEIEELMTIVASTKKEIVEGK